MFKSRRGVKAAVVRKAGLRKMNRRRVPRAPRAPPSQIARCIETTEADEVSGQMYSLYNLNLTQFSRALTIAKGYQFFRISKVEMVFVPQYDTFDANGPTRVPHLYWQIDRLKQLQYSNTYKQLEKLGSKPHRLDDKMVRFSYKPSVLVGVLDAQAVATTQFDNYKISPWLNCRDMNTIGAWVANGTDHTGVVWYVDAQGANPVPFRIERRIHFEFKKPATDVTVAEDINNPAQEAFPDPDVIPPL